MGEYGYSVGKFLAFVWVDAEHAKIGTKLKVRCVRSVSLIQRMSVLRRSFTHNL